MNNKLLWKLHFFLLDRHSRYMMLNMRPFYGGLVSHVLVAAAVPLKSGTNVNQRYCCNFAKINPTTSSSHPSATAHHMRQSTAKTRRPLRLSRLQIESRDVDKEKHGDTEFV